MAIAALSIPVVVTACGGGGSSKVNKQDLIDVVTSLASTNGGSATQAELDFFRAHITDAFAKELGGDSVEGCLQSASDCIGEALNNPTVDPTTVDVNGDAASLVLASDQGTFGVKLIKDGDTWKADGFFVSNDAIPEGADVVNVELVEFAIAGDFKSAPVKSGDFALHVKNSGEQNHEVILVPLPAEGAIEDLLQDESFDPQPVFVKFPYHPGEESDVVLPAPLSAGRYAFVCFLPDTADPDGTPHAFKGMVSEFTVE